MVFKSINPFTQLVIEQFDEYPSEKINAMIALANVTFTQWRKTDITERNKFMKKAAELLRQKKATYAKTISLEMGKPIRESVDEIEKCAWVCDYYAENAQRFLQDTIIETDAMKSFVRYEPLGTVLAIMPWNFPFWQTFRFAAPALMAGNTALLKHASNVTRCALHIEAIFGEAGFPDGVFQTLILESSKIGKLIENNIVKAVTLTGSEKAGASVASIAGKNIKKTVLELGGSNSFVVLSDANLEKAIEIGVQARMRNAGQSCIAAKRFIIMEEVIDKFLAGFKEKITSLRHGDPLDSATELGPLARVDLAKQLENQVNQSVAMGAKIITGGSRKEAYYAPTLLSNVKPGMPAFDEELFGPVAAVTTVKTEEEALAMANQSSFGLGATVFTTSNEKASNFIENIEDGAVFINALVKSDPRLPFGGTKKSGYGRELSEHGIKEFVNIKTVYVN